MSSHERRTAARRLSVAVITALTFVAVTVRFGSALATSSVSSQLLFGPKQYLRTTGAPNQYTDRFSLTTIGSGPFVLRVVNGDNAGGHRISSATITLNSATILSQKDFSQNVATLERNVALKTGTNTLQVTLASTPGSYLTISILAPAVKPVAVSLKPDPLSLRSGTSGALTATLSPIPTAPGRLAVTTSARAIAGVPTSVAFAAG